METALFVLMIGTILIFCFAYWKTSRRIKSLEEKFKNEQQPAEESSDQIEKKKIEEEVARKMEEGLNSILNYQNPAKGQGDR